MPVVLCLVLFFEVLEQQYGYHGRPVLTHHRCAYGKEKEIFSLFEDVLFLRDKALSKERKWFAGYKTATNNASPTTDRIAYHLLREDYPDAEVVPVNFKPDGNNGSYKWHKHDWQYEAEYYRRHEVPIRIQF